MTRGSESTAAWVRHRPDDPLVQDWMRVVPLHQREDRIGEVAVRLMNEPENTVTRVARKALS